MEVNPPAWVPPHRERVTGGAPAAFQWVLGFRIVPCPDRPSQESVVSGGPPTHGSVHCGMQLSRRRRVCRDTVTLYPVDPIPAWIKRTRDHLIAENAKIGGFLMNPSQ